ncbi:DUF222 domain-containing protein, partial [Mycolicibacterium fallax]
MFERLDREALTSADAADLVATISASALADAAAAAARYAAIGELLARNEAEADAHAAYDGWTATTAEVGAAMGISARRAGSLLHAAKALRTRLPKIAALLATGAVSERIVAVVTWRTRLVMDPQAAAEIDTELAAAVEQAARYGGVGTLSNDSLDMLVDAAICKHDPDAVRRIHQAARARDISFGKPDDETGLRSVYGAVLATDAPIIDAVLSSLASSVCPEDPRSIGERRSDAFALLHTGITALPCRCNRPECPQNTTGATDGNGVVDRTRAGSVVIEVLADQAAIEQAIAEAAGKPSIGRPWLESRKRTVWVYPPGTDWSGGMTPEEIAEITDTARRDAGPGWQTRRPVDPAGQLGLWEHRPVSMPAALSDSAIDAELAALLTADAAEPRPCARHRGLPPDQPPDQPPPGQPPPPPPRNPP